MRPSLSIASNEDLETLRHFGPAGFVLAFNVSTFKGPDQLHLEYPAEWQQHYEDSEYFFLDPVFLWAATHIGETRWSDIRMPDPRGVLKKAAAFGLNYGCIFSRKSKSSISRRSRSILSIAREDREFTDTEMQFLRIIFDRLVERMSQGHFLTDKEVACLTCIAEGLDFALTAEHLGISVPTVKARLAKAREKMGAKTTAQAISLASKEGVI